jgi:cobalt-precorrin-5B (C1)-methyltransferase
VDGGITMTKPRENLRSGYTTGACAAAAAKAALLALIEQQAPEVILIRLPGGQEVHFALHTCTFRTDEARASIIKDAGDDPDVTHGAEVCVRVWRTETPGVSFRAGVGVGTVTKKGLPVPPGEPAINPAPRALIADTIAGVLAERGDDGRGVAVEVSVPDGAERAKKTFNPRLGIVGGISILGTTGIVVPYSTDAWLASVVQGIDVAAAQGLTHLVLTVGERGERFARALFPLPEEAFVQVGPFFGDSLRHCAKVGIARVTLVSMLGKLAKFAAGHESVHSTNSSQDFAFLAELAREAGGSDELQASIRTANTAQEVGGMAEDVALVGFFDRICLRASQFARRIVGESPAVEVYLTSQRGAVLSRFPPADST